MNNHKKNWTAARLCMCAMPILLIALPVILRFPWYKYSPFYSTVQIQRTSWCKGNNLRHIYFAMNLY
ncbi:MAG TPA: hypothetical protein VF719_05000, partial [Abditibacteriaceae bacterium]